MRFVPVLIGVVWLVGCTTTPIIKPNKVEEASNTPPLIAPPMKPPVESLDALKRYRDTLVAYHNYLTGYVNYISASNGLVEPFGPEPTCAFIVPLIDISLPTIPKIKGLEDAEAVDRLIDHIEVLRSRIADHNRQMAEIRRQRSETCVD